MDWRPIFLQVLFHRTSALSSNYDLIVIDIRLPRILLGIVVGASLSVAGTAFQALLRNPLADLHSGRVKRRVAGRDLDADCAAVPRATAGDSVVLTPIGAFLGAAATIAAVYLLGRREGLLDSNTLLLSGIVSGSFLVRDHYVFDVHARGARRSAWHLVLADGRSFDDFAAIVALVPRVGFLVASGVIYATASDLNLMLNGEKEAMHLGVDVPRVRTGGLYRGFDPTGLAVSVSGAIGYVGLLVPHVMRLIFGSDHRILIPTSAFGGAIAVVLADTLARTVVAPSELPVGAMTALAGAPLFIYLLRRKFA